MQEMKDAKADGLLDKSSEEDITADEETDLDELLIKEARWLDKIKTTIIDKDEQLKAEHEKEIENNLKVDPEILKLEAEG